MKWDISEDNCTVSISLGEGENPQTFLRAMGKQAYIFQRKTGFTSIFPKTIAELTLTDEEIDVCIDMEGLSIHIDHLGAAPLKLNVAWDAKSNRFNFDTHYYFQDNYYPVALLLRAREIVTGVPAISFKINDDSLIGDKIEQAITEFIGNDSSTFPRLSGESDWDYRKRFFTKDYHRGFIPPFKFIMFEILCGVSEKDLLGNPNFMQYYKMSDNHDLEKPEVDFFVNGLITSDPLTQ